MTGPQAGVLKYDILTALTLIGLNGSQTLQTSMLRLIALITARYNWRLDELSMGQRDMARLWSVNERTVKREVKRLMEVGVLLSKRSGVRGRVGSYCLNHPEIAKLSEPNWLSVGVDFDGRMRERYQTKQARVVSLKAYRCLDDTKPKAVKPGTWESAMAHLASTDLDRFEAWYSRLDFIGFDQGLLCLRAPSKFIQRYIETHLLPTLIGAVEPELGPVDHVQFYE